MTGAIVAIELRRRDRLRNLDRSQVPPLVLAEVIRIQLQYQDARRRAWR